MSTPDPNTPGTDPAAADPAGEAPDFGDLLDEHGRLTREPTPEEQEQLMAAYEQQMSRVRTEDIVVQCLAQLVELGGRRAGLAQGSEAERDPDQLRVAIDGVRALLPVAEPLLGPNVDQVRQALSQLELAYTQITGKEAPAPPAAGGAAGPAPSKLWVPGQ